MAAQVSVCITPGDDFEGLVVRHINAAVRELSGVIDVEVKLKEGTVAVDFDPALAKQELIVGAIQSAGYDVTGTVS